MVTCNWIVGGDVGPWNNPFFTTLITSFFLVLPHFHKLDRFIFLNLSINPYRYDLLLPYFINA